METLQKLIFLLKRYADWKTDHAKGWFGKVEISYEDSNIVNVKVTENIKL